MEIPISLVIFILLFLTIKSGVVADRDDGVYEEVRVGLVVNLGSIEGKILETSFSLALSDFYRINNGFRTRISVSSKDSRGDPLLAFAAATDLLETVNVEAIVGALSLQEAKLLVAISEKAKVLVISPLLPISLSLKKYDHFLQLTHDSTSEAKGITKLIHDFNWKSIVVVYEDVDDWIETKHSSVVIGVWAHGIASILATAIEKMRLRASVNVSLDLLETIRQNRFKGLSHGDIQIVGNKFLSGTFEIVNMVGTGERRIGLWSCNHFYGRKHVMASSANELETIIWPGGSGRIPSHRLLAENGEKKKLLRVLVTSSNRFPHLMAVRPDPETGLINITGFCAEVFRTCIAPLNYELEFIPYDGSNYDNLAYELSTQRDKYDAAVGDISITSDRFLHVEFSLPYTDMGIGLLELKKKRESMWTFFDPLEKSLWLASGAFFILTGIVVWLVERTVNPEFQGSWRQQLGVFDMIDTESISNGFGFMFQRGSGLAHNVSREIAKLRSSGTLRDLEKRWFQKLLDSYTENPTTDLSENEDVSKRLTIRELGGLFIIAGVAHALVLATYLFQTRREILCVLWESRLFTKLLNFSGFCK